MNDPWAAYSLLCIVDTETSGLWSKRHGEDWCRTLEIGAVVLDARSQIRAQFCSLVRPDILDGRANYALQINDLTPEQLDSAPPPEQVREAFRWWWHAQGRPFLAAYNNDFDRQSLESIGIETTRWGPCIMREAARAIKAIDPTYSITEDGKPKFPKLAEAVEFYGVPRRRAHSAINDAIMAAGVLDAVRNGKPRKIDETV